jgi:arylsulfatase A-like enzyme
MAASGWLVLLVCVAAGCRRTTPPNIILYVVDTLRADALGCYGNPSVQTPTMDRLAREGIRFARAYADASWTRASMGTLFTGEYPNTHGAVGRADALRRGITTLPMQLRARGYRTAAIIANPNIGSTFGFAEGFTDFVELYNSHPEHTLVMPAELLATADRVVDAASAWLQAHPAGPFFLLVFSVDPHAPYTPPAPYDNMYDPTYRGKVDGSLQSLFELAVREKVPDESDIRHLRALYHGEVTFNDMQLGRLLGELDRARLSENTVVIVTSDHGEEFYEHGGRDHGHTLFEEVIRVPLIIRWPGRIPRGTVVPEAVQLADLYPTLLRLAGVSPRPGAFTTVGRDLTDVLLGRGSNGVAPLAYAEEHLDGHNLRALIMDHRKVLYDVTRQQPFVFDLARDPAELQRGTELPPQDLWRTFEKITQANQPPRGSVARPVHGSELPDAARHAMEALGYGDPLKDR